MFCHDVPEEGFPQILNVKYILAPLHDHLIYVGHLWSYSTHHEKTF